MSFFKKLFGGASYEDERKTADRLFEQKAYAEARLAYERAQEKAPDDDVGEACGAQRDECLDRLALARIEEGEHLLEIGDLDLAASELENAMELAASDAVFKRARRRLETLEKEDAKIAQADVPEEMSDEDRWALLAGSWSEDQLGEYDEYGDEFRVALLEMHDMAAVKAAAKLGAELARLQGDEEDEEADEESAEEAEPTPRDTLEEILEEAEEPLYLFLEVGRARALEDDFEGAEEALREFLEGIEDDEGGDAQLRAHASLAAIRDQAGDDEGAMAEYEEAMESFPDDPRPFFLMGSYLRSKGLPSEAADVLEAAVPLLDEDQPDWRFLEELGLSHYEAGNESAAAGPLDQVLAFFVAMRRHDRELAYSPPSAITRAKIFENEGRLDKAADIYRSLASGPDTANHLLYHREAGRVLLELELFDDARRMMTRALALAEGDPDLHQEIEGQLEELE